MMASALQRRRERARRNASEVDLNLVSLIDVFTILIFFLLSSSSEVEVLPATRAVRLPESTAQQVPRDTVVVVVSAREISVGGRSLALVADALASPGDEIAPLRDELAALAGRTVVRSANQAQARAVTIMGDKDIPYRLLRKIMVSASRASYQDVSFAVRPTDLKT